MSDLREALKHINTLAKAAAESDDLDIVQEHIAMISEVANKALLGDPPNRKAAPLPKE
jgi:hypothetical protein